MLREAKANKRSIEVECDNRTYGKFKKYLVIKYYPQHAFIRQVFYSIRGNKLFVILQTLSKEFDITHCKFHLLGYSGKSTTHPIHCQNQANHDSRIEGLKIENLEEAKPHPKHPENLPIL